MEGDFTQFMFYSIKKKSCLLIGISHLYILVRKHPLCIDDSTICWQGCFSEYMHQMIIEVIYSEK